MSILQANGAGLGGAGDPGGALGSFYSTTIDQSLRFEEAGSSYLTFTPSSNGTDNKRYTFSVWIKLAQGSGDFRTVFSSKNTGSGTGQGHNTYAFGTDDDFELYTQNGNANPTSPRLYRDPNSWYHFLIVYDTTQATDTDRVKVYVNGTQQTDYTGTFPSLNSVMASVNTNGQEQRLGRYVSAATRYFNGYMAEIHMVDGQALNPTYFGETIGGVWVPKEYPNNGTTSHGVNGYHLTFQGTGTATTSQGTTAQINIGDDQSGNGNNWTVSGIVSDDVLLDSPTNNFCTLNLLSQSTSADWTLSEGNLHCAAPSSSGWQSVRGTHGVSSGKWYWEVEFDAGTMTEIFCGIMNQNTVPHATSDFDDTTGVVLFYNHVGGEIRYNNTLTDNNYGTLVAGDILGVALNMDDKQLSFYKNGSAIVTNFDIDITGITTVVPAAASDGFSVVLKFNFGQDSANVSSANSDENGIGTFEYAVPSGFLALCSANLPEPAIGPNSDTTSDQNFDTILYTAATSNGTYTHGNLAFRPDFSWIKNRNNVERHFLTDVVRGNTSVTDKFLVSSATSAEGANGVSGTTFSVTDTGYEFVETSITSGELYFNGRTYVGWNWKAGGTASSIAVDEYSTGVPSIASSVSANPDAGFSIVSWSSTNTDNQTIGHGLSATPELIISKSRNTAGTDWWVWAASESGKYGRLNSGGAFVSDTSIWYTAGMSSTTFGVRSLGNNYLSRTYIAYCFHSVPGYSAVGSYIGNANADGTFVYLGFRPRWLMFKDVSNTNIEWNIYYDEASPFNVMNDYIAAASSAAEATNISTRNLDFVSNGFKLRDAFAQNYSANYVYIAFAEAPFKYANAR